MTTLREPFDNVLRREGKFDYVPWSSVGDRLDEAAPEGWSFAIMGIGPDWVHGRLTIGDRWFENIGYAENADADWMKEALKHAATDAFKRCAALAGVARYLYDKDSTAGPSSSRNGNVRGGPPPSRTSAPARTSTDMPEFPDDFGTQELPANGSGWSFKELAEATEAAGLPKNKIYQTADSLFGKDTKVTSLTGPQREQIAFEMGLVG
jgi:hypothetical protein